MKKIMYIVLLFSMMFGLSACGNLGNISGDYEREDVELTFFVTSGAQKNEQNTGWTGGSRTQVTKTFKTNPAVVAIFSYDALDILDYVGIENTSIKRLGLPKANIPTYLSDYNTQDVLNVGTLFIPDLDALSLFIPDLIIIGGRSAGAYDQLSAEYPYADILDVGLVYGEYIEGMERNATNLGKIFPTVNTEIETAFDLIATQFTTLKNTAKDYRALFVMVNGDALSFYGSTGRFAVLYDEFGFIPADPLFQEDGSHGNVVGYEYVKSVNPDVLFLLDRGVATGGSASIDQVKANQLIKDTNAGMNNYIFTLNPIAWYISVGGFTSTNTMIENIQSAITVLKA